MLLPLLLSLAGPALQADNPPPPVVRVDINHEQLTRGDRARVYVQTAQDGHLVVLHADPDGRVRVLFPLDPSEDDFVRGGKRIEIRGRSDRNAFFVDADGGTGTVVAVLSQDPLSYDAFARNDHWDFRALGASDVRSDPLAGLLDIARRMAGETRFEYDAATYVVGGRIASHYGYGPDYYGAGYYGYGYPYRFRFGLSFGTPYGYDPFCYDPFWGWSPGCSPFGFGYSAYYFGRPYGYRPYGFSRFSGSGFGRGFVGGPRFVIPRDRVLVTGIQPRRRDATANPGPVARDFQPRQRGPVMSPRGGSSRGPTMSRPSGGSRGRSGPPSGGGGSRGGTRSGGGGGGRRH
jgi:uncharacterized membrane protein YgcG